ncbi:MAG: type II toxin-antitoxin system RelE/ParE family toxin [Gammaproteobacteria bacterium]|nr:type II toxin-antitoxin system RelE/ParE family toxin [Gammaproteobacteria bacterium]
MRSIGWVRAARRDYAAFPPIVRDRINTALSIAAQGSKADIASPLKGLGPGVMEVAVRHRSDAWRVVYVNEISGTLWILHAFRKKSKRGIQTPKPEIDLVRARLRRLRRELANDR